MHDAFGAEDFVLAEANMEVDRKCGPIWAFGCSSTNLVADMDARPFTDIARRNFNILYEEHICGCPMGLYASIGA